jgi:hypothetical protein
VIHKARIPAESIENLGARGMAFSVICCDDPGTVTRHTLHKAHTLSDDELKAVLTRYVRDHARDHAASERNHRRTLELSGQIQCEACE